MTEKTKSYSHDEFANRLAHLLFISFVIAAAICIFYYYHFSGAISQEHKTWAEFGDFVGGTVGTLVSFFALFALLLTISLQSKALRVSQQELKLTREEAAKASEAAQAQVEHFHVQASIDDIVASIRELENELKARSNDTLVVFNKKALRVTTVALKTFIAKDTYQVSFLSPGDAGPDAKGTHGNRQEELGQLFKLLFDQIMSLREFPSATNRYRIFIHKHLEMFYYLGTAGVLPFDWKAPLDKESKDLLKIYDNALRREQARNNPAATNEF